MLRFIIRRLVVALLVTATVMTLAFILTRLSGDLAISIAGPNATHVAARSHDRARMSPPWIEHPDGIAVGGLRRDPIELCGRHTVWTRYNKTGVEFRKDCVSVRRAWYVAYVMHHACDVRCTTHAD